MTAGRRQPTPVVRAMDRCAQHPSPQHGTRGFRSARTPHGHALILAAMAALVLLMPVSYRGGAETVHPHTAFQVWIDAALGGIPGHHHHGGEAPHDHGAGATESAPRVQEAPHHVDAPVVMLGDAARGEGGDTPTVSAMKPPLQHAMPLLALGGLALVLGLLMSAQRRPLWAWSGSPGGCLLCPDPPPPRLRCLP